MFVLKLIRFNPFQPIVSFHIETSHLICSAKQMTDFYMKCNTGLEWANYITSKMSLYRVLDSDCTIIFM